MPSGSPAARAQPSGSLLTSLRPLALLCLLALLALPARAQDPASASPSATPSVSSTVSPSYNPAPSAAPPPLTALAALATPISFGLLFQRQAGGGSATLSALPVQSALCASVAQALGVPYSALAVVSQGPLQWAQLTPFGYSLPPGAAPGAQAGHRMVLAIDGAVLARLPAYAAAAAEGTPALVAAFKASLVSTTAFLMGLLRTQPSLVELLGYSTSEALAAHFSLDPTVPVATAASSAAQLSPFLVVAWAFPLGLVLAGMLFVATKRALCSSGGNSGSGSSSGGGGGRSVGGRRAASARAPRASTLTSTPSRRAAPAEPEGGGWLGCMDEPTCLSPDPEPLDTPAPVMLRAVGGKRGGGEGEVGAVGGGAGGAGAAAASAIEAAGSTGEALPVVQVALSQGQGDNDLEPSSFASPSNGAYKTP